MADLISNSKLSKAQIQPKFILRFSRFNLPENLPPQMITSRVAVTSADVKRAQKALIDTSNLIEKAAEHGLTREFEPTPSDAPARLRTISSELDSRRQEAFRAHKIDEEKQGNRVLSSNARLELADGDSFVAAFDNVSADADKVLQVLRYRLGRIKKFARSHPPDPIEALKRDEVLDLTAARTLATQNPMLLFARWVRKSGRHAVAERIASLFAMLKASFPAFEAKSSELRN